VPRGQRNGSLQPYSLFSRQEPLLFYQVAPQSYSWGWVSAHIWEKCLFKDPYIYVKFPVFLCLGCNLILSTSMSHSYTDFFLFQLHSFKMSMVTFAVKYPTSLTGKDSWKWVDNEWNRDDRKEWGPEEIMKLQKLSFSMWYQIS
jgi:hypothetical protein